MTVQEIREAMEELSWEYGIVAIRTQDEPFELGPITHCSHIWDDGEDTGEELDGICGTDIKGIEMHLDSYVGDHIAIIAGRYHERGEDPHEVIITEDAECVLIIK